jgi:hypothetical protein
MFLLFSNLNTSVRNYLCSFSLISNQKLISLNTFLKYKPGYTKSSAQQVNSTFIRQLFLANFTRTQDNSPQTEHASELIRTTHRKQSMPVS